MRLEPNIPGDTEFRGLDAALPGAECSAGWKTSSEEKEEQFTQHDVSHCNRLSFLFTPAQERISTQLEKWLDDLLDEFGPAREYPVHAAYTVERNIHLINPHSGYIVQL